MRLLIGMCVALFISVSAGAADIQAIVNDTPISEFDVEARAKMLMVQQGEPVDKLTPDVKRVALEDLINERIKMQEMVRREIEVPEENIKNALAHLEQQNNMPVGRFKQILESQGVPYQTLLDQTKANLGWLQLLQKSGHAISVSPADVAARKKIIRQDLMRDSVSFAEIVVKTEEDAFTVLNQLQSGSDFGTMVDLYSIADSRLNGGRVMDADLDYYGDEVAEIFNEMQVGQLSRPIKIKDGYALFLMMKKREAVTGDTITVWELAQAIIPKDSAILSLLEQPVQNGCDTFAEIVGDKALAGTFQRGQVTPSQLPEDIFPILQDAEFKKVVGPVQTPVGLLYFMKCNQSEERVMPSDKMLEMMIENEKLDLLSGQLLSEIKRDAVIEYK